LPFTRGTSYGGSALKTTPVIPTSRRCRHRNPACGLTLVVVLASILLTPGGTNAATISWDGGGDGASWTDPLNWSGDVLPGTADTAVLNVGADPTVTLSGPAVTLAALDCRENLVLAGEGLIVTGSCAFRDRRVQLDAGVLDAPQVQTTSATVVIGNGTATGDVTLFAGRLEFAPGATGTGRFHLRGTGTLAGNVTAGSTVAIEGTVANGAARWSAAGDWINAGTLQFITVVNDYHDRGTYLTVQGVLTNAPSGRIDILAGTGDSRVLYGNLRNEGTLSVEASTELSIQGVGDVPPQLTLAGGQWDVPGGVVLEGGRMTVLGGTINGPLRGHNSEFDIGPDIAGPLTVRAVGANCRFLGNASPGVTLWAEGTVRWSYTTLTVAGDIVNRGTLHLESSSDDYQNRGSYLSIATGARLHSAVDGRITAAPGAGDSRSITGSLYNEGAIDVATGTAVEFRGRLESAGGTYAGAFRVLDSQVTFPAAPAAPTELYLYGANNQLLSDVPARTIVRLVGTTTYGAAWLTSPAGCSNDGILRLTCGSNDYQDRGAYLQVNGGAFTNRSEGRIEVLAANGDPRRIVGKVINQGTITVEEGITFNISGTDSLFRQAAGALSVQGGFMLENSRFELAGGTVSGLVRVYNSTIATEATASEPAVIRIVGPENELERHAAVSTTLWIEGTVTWELARLRVPLNTFSAGIIHLETTSNDGWDRGCYLNVEAGATLTNSPSGRITAEPGLGDGRLIRGSLCNQGQITVAAGTTIDYRGRLESAGGTYTGDFRVLQSAILLTASPAEPTELFLYGPENQLLSDIPTRTIVRVVGTVANNYGRLTIPTGCGNDGILRMTCGSNDGWDRGAYINVTEGAFTNRTDGRIEVLAANGDPRRIVGNVLNQGTIAIEEGVTLNVSGSTPLFRQAAGESSVQGSLLLETGRFELAGGTISGVVRALNSTIATEASADQPNVVRLVGPENRLDRHAAALSTLWIEGTTTWGYAQLRVPSSTVSDGIIHLSTTSNDGWDRGCYLTIEAGATLTNAPGARITAAPDTGDGRSLTGHLWHQGRIEVASGTALTFTGQLDLDGGIASGDLQVINASIATHRAAAEPTVIPIYHAGNQLLSDVEPDYTLWVRGTVNPGYARLTATQAFTLRGIIRLESASKDGWDRSSNFTLQNGTLTIAPEGRLESLPGAGGSRSIDAEVANAGTILISTSTALGRTSAVHSNSGTILLAGTTLALSGTSLVIEPTGVLAGTGTFDARNVSTRNRGTVRPGASPGLLTWRGAYTAESSARLELEAAGIEAGTRADQLAIDGSAFLNGQLRLSLVEDYVPAAGDVLSVVKFASVGGTFNSLHLPTLPTGLAWLPEFTASEYRLKVLTETDATNLPPSIVTHPKPVTVVKGRTATFHVIANGSYPLSFQWQWNEVDLEDATHASLTLERVQLEQQGSYRVIVSNAVGSVTSSVATLTVLPAVGTIIPATAATTSFVPGIPGDGVEVAVYNGIGGTKAPAYADLTGLAPTGTTLSPTIDFPHPGSTVTVGNSFDSFFADTTTPPTALSAVAARNFLLDHQFLLRVEAAADKFPETPEIDLDLGVGSDDGFRLQVGSTELGYAGDRGFTYSWYTVSFESEGLYPVRLLFAANATGYSGLEFSWRTALASQEIVPQRALYRSSLLGDQLITFDDLPADTRITDEYLAQGARFTTVAGDPRVTAERPDRFVPVSPPQVFGDPTEPAAVPFVVDITFVTPEEGFPAATEFFSFFVIDAETGGALVEAFDPAGASLYAQEFHGGGAAREQGVIAAPQIARVRITQLDAADAIALDHISLVTPTPMNLPPVLEALGDVDAPEGTEVVFQAQAADPDAGQELRFALRAGAPAGAAIDPVTGVFTWATDETDGPGDYAITVVVTDNGQPALSDEQQIHLRIAEVNTAPTLAAMAPLWASADAPLLVKWSAFDADLPAQSLRFGLGPDAPTGLTLDPLTGEMTWTVDRTTPPGVYSTTVEVSDDGSPELSAQRPCTITVDHNGPLVLSATPAGIQNQPVQVIDLQFNRPLLASSVAVADFALSGPEGAVAINRVELPAADRIRLQIPQQRRSGNYTLRVGPDIRSLNGAPMNQDGDAQNGEPNEDVFQGVFRIQLPDLQVSLIRSPATGAPGEPVTLVWGITNRGAATALPPWFESVRLSPDETIGNDQTVADFQILAALPPAIGILRTQVVVLPLTGVAGTLHFVVTTDANGSIAEETEDNNSLLADTSIHVAPGLSVQLARSEVTEGAPAFQGIARRNGALDQPLTVTLMAEPAGQIDLPAALVLPAGQSSVTFDLIALNDGVVDGDAAVTVRAHAEGYLDGTASLLVRDVNVPQLRLSLPNSQVSEGKTLTGTVSREPITPGSLVVRFASQNPSQLAVPGEAVIPAGAASAPFLVEPVDDRDIERDIALQVTANADGFTGAVVEVTVLDNDAPTLELVVSPSTFSEGAGPTAAVGTLLRRPASTQPLTVALASSTPTAAQVPARVTIPAESASVTFPVSAVDDTTADGPQPATLTASWIDTPTGQVFAPATQTEITVTDDDAPALIVRIAQDAVAEGLSPATTATVQGNQDTQAPVTVTLTSSDPGELTAPPTVVLPSGSAQVTVPLNSIDDGVADGSQMVVLTASAPGFLAGSDQVVVTDVNLPDLVIERLNGPASGSTEATFQVAFRETNRGLGPATGTWRQTLYLSDDPFPGNDFVLGSVDFTGTIPPELYFERVLQFWLPSTPGTYWLVAVSDPDNTVAELIEGNNTVVAAVPIEVTAAYTATVSTAIDLAPAGTPIPLSGQALMAAGGQPASYQLVNIHVVHGDTRRILSALTDTDGRFTATFNPLPGEAGSYQIGAAHPGVAEAPVQDQFTLLGMRFVDREAALTLAGPDTQSAGLDLRNLSSIGLTGLSATASGQPDWLDLALSVPPTLPGDGVVTVRYTATNRRDTAALAEIWIEVRADGGLLARLPFTVRVQPRIPRLVATLSRLESGMLRGEQTLLSLGVRNDGGAASGPVSVLTPDFPWLAVASAQPLPSLEPGAQIEVTLRLSPPPDLPLGRYEGTLTLTADGTAANVPFSFLALSEATGSLVVETVDEFTYYAAGSPRIPNAAITLIDELTGVPAGAGHTDDAGQLAFPSLREGYYRIHATANGHTPADALILVPAGQNTSHILFLSRNTVEYRWTVTPTEIEDRTRITVEAVFETVVPAPVVVVEPSVIDFAEFIAEVSQVDLKITNHGLIAANDAALSFPTLAGWQIEPLITDLGNIPARSSMTIPVIIRRVTGGGSPAPAGAGLHSGSLGCRAAALLYRLVCGPFNNTYSVTIGLANDGSGCPLGGGGGWIAAQGGGSGSFTAPRAVKFDSKCGPGPCAAEIGKWAFDCAFGLLPFPDPIKCGKGVYDCISSAVSSGLSAGTGLTCVGTLLDCASALGKSVNPLIGGALGVLSCAEGMRGVAECLEKAAKEKASQSGKVALADWDYDLPPELLMHFQIVEDRLYALQGHLAVYEVLLGNPAWFHPGMDESLSTWLIGFQQATGTATPLGTRIDLDERAQLAAGPLPPKITAAEVNQFADRWNRTVSNYEAGIFRRADLPAGGNPDFIDVDDLLAAAATTASAIVATEAAGFDDPVLALQSAVAEWKAAIEASGLVDFIPRSSSGSTSGAVALASSGDGSAGICAQVRLQIDQEAVISRDAFEARLEVDNLQANPLRNVQIDLVVSDTAGLPATSRFGVRQPAVTGFGAIDGTGRLEGQTTGTVTWTIIPSSEAAPVGPVTYVVSGTLRYVDEGIEVTLPLAPASIDVFPNASLAVKYFHQRDVLADDPFTPDIAEPSIPYSLAVLVENRGRGEARNVRITSAQPRIVDNEKGLLVDFRIIGTEVDGKNLSPSLTVNLGNLAPDTTAVGRWLLRSSLQGQFVEYAATFEHLDGFGDPRLSLIESVEIHELIRIVDAGDTDARPDFLVNDLEDDAFLPDTLYLSGGGIQPVTPVTQGTTDGAPTPEHLEVTLTATPAAGWSYLRLPDPAAGGFVLTGVRRPNGTMLPTANFWTTDRTFIAGGRRPVYEHVLHLLDRDGPGTYTLVYAPPAPVDVLPPTSALAALPAASPALIPISWTGQDETGGSGVSGYDIYVATDGGAFVPWLRNTLATAATFIGEPNRTYAFYSIATDAAGNREEPPATPDAHTTTSVANQPPALDVPPELVVVEGDTLQLDLDASDPDEPRDRLTFRLGANPPAGVLLDPVTGRLSWITSEELGPSTNTIPVSVSDDGIPPLAASAELRVVITELNTAPEIQTIPNALVNEGRLLEFLVLATDADRPANALRFRLLDTPPAGALLDPLTGRFTWTPSRDQGGAEYALAIEVSDDASPPLTAVSRFTVAVNDVHPDFTLSAGHSHTVAGQVGRVLLELDTRQPLAEITLNLLVPPEISSSPNLTAIAQEIREATLGLLEPNLFRLVFTANPTQPFNGRVTLGELSFPTQPEAASACAPILLSEVVGERLAGGGSARGRARNGLLVILGPQPVLVAELEGDQPVLRLFAHPGEPVEILHQPGLDPNASWSAVRRLTPDTIETVLPDLDEYGFYRAVAGVPPLPDLRMTARTDGTLEIRVTGTPYATWVLEQTASFATPNSWTQAAVVDLSTGTWIWPVPPPATGENARWYRLREVAVP